MFGMCRSRTLDDVDGGIRSQDPPSKRIRVGETELATFAGREIPPPPMMPRPKFRDSNESIEEKEVHERYDDLSRIFINAFLAGKITREMLRIELNYMNHSETDSLF